MTATERFLLAEAMKGAGINACVDAAISWSVMHGVDTVPILGWHGLVLDMVPSTFLSAFFICLILTFVMRKRLREDKIAPQIVQELRLWPRFYPFKTVLVRCAVSAGFLAVVWSILVLIFAKADAIAALPFGLYMSFKIFHGAAVGAVMAPFAIASALHERTAAQSQPSSPATIQAA